MFENTEKAIAQTEAQRVSLSSTSHGFYHSMPKNSIPKETPPFLKAIQEAKHKDLGKFLYMLTQKELCSYIQQNRMLEALDTLMRGNAPHFEKLLVLGALKYVVNRLLPSHNEALILDRTTLFELLNTCLDQLNQISPSNNYPTK